MWMQMHDLIWQITCTLYILNSSMHVLMHKNVSCRTQTGPQSDNFSYVEKNCWMTSRENDVFLPLKSLLLYIVSLQFTSLSRKALYTLAMLLSGLVFLNTGRVLWQNFAERKSEPWTGVADFPAVFLHISNFDICHEIHWQKSVE